MMSGIRSKNTKPELAVRSHLHKAGLRFRLHAKLPGKPDLVLPKYRVAIFVHGCFWHRHENCRLSTTPRTNLQFWEKKFSDNVRRDALAIKSIENQGWKVHVIWSCQINEVMLDSIVMKIKHMDT